MNNTYQQPDLWGNLPKDYSPASYTPNERSRKTDYIKEFSAIRQLLTEISKVLTEHGEILKDHTAMLDELTAIVNDNGN